MGLKKPTQSTSGGGKSGSPGGSSGKDGSSGNDDKTENDDDSGGDGGADGGDDESGDDAGDENDEKVSRDSYLKLLKEKKKLQQGFRDLQTEVDGLKKKTTTTTDEEDPKDAKNHKKLLSLREQEIADLRKKFDDESVKNKSLTDRLNTGKKWSEFKKSLDVDLPGKYAQLVDFDEIIIDDDGELDAASVKKAVSVFSKTYPELLKVTKPKTPPGDGSNRGGAGKITYEHWLTLPPDQMRKRQKDVVD